MTHLLFLLFCSPALPIDTLDAEVCVTTSAINPLRVTAHTGMKPQSKLWKYRDTWWGVFSDSTGTHIWRLEENRWQRTLRISSDTDVRADVLASGDLVEILLFRGVESSLIRCMQWDRDDGHTISLDHQTPVKLDEGVETATMARDDNGRLWIASDGETTIHARWIEKGADAVSGSLVLAEGVSKDDICVITSLQDGSVGVLWSNQNAQRYGFRRHVGSSNPDEWFPDEIPASASAIDHGDGMSADHLNVAVGSDGTLYATVKTSYDTEGMPLVATLVRRPYGRWDPLYHVDDEGSRGIMILDESKEIFLGVYTSYRDQSFVLKRSHTDSISIHNRVTLLKRDRINNVGATRQNVSGSFPIVATQGDSLMHTILVELK